MSYVLEIDHVTKTFGQKHVAVTAVDDVSLQVAEGQLVVVMGPSGSGKTTLLQIVGALLTPSQGAVRINGIPLGDRSRKELARLRLHEIGFIFQGFNLFAALSAADNVALPATLAGRPRSDGRQNARELLRDLGLGPRMGHLPEELSGGEKQRVAIARALVNNPKLILADEPTANLDSASGYQVLHLLQDIAGRQGKTVIVVTHDHRLGDSADRLLWLADGRLADRESSFETAADPVCGMEIIVDRAAGMRHHRGKTYYLCSQICLARFDAAPFNFVRSIGR